MGVIDDRTSPRDFVNPSKDQSKFILMEVQSTNSSGSSQKKIREHAGFFWASLASVVLLIAAYSNFFHQSFQFEDRQVIQDNLYIQNVESISQLFSDPRDALNISADIPYRPLVSLSYTVDYWIAGGLVPRQFHLTQFIFVAFLCMGFAIVGQFFLDRVDIHWSNKYVALGAALLCCVHIANAEILSQIASRASLLATLGVVGSFVMYGCLPTWRPSHLYLLPMMLGMLAHPLGVLFVPLLLVYVLVFEKRLSCQELCSANAWPKIQHALGKVLPAFLTGMALLLFLDSVIPLHTPSGETFSDALFLQPFLWLHYLQRFFLPFVMTEDIVWDVPRSIFDPRFLAGMFCIVLLGRMVWASSHTKELRPVTFGIMWFIIGMLGAVSTGDPENWTHQPQGLFPFLGLTLAVMSWVGYQLQKCRSGFIRRNSLTIPMVCLSGVLLLAAHAVGTYQHHDSGFSIGPSIEVSGVDRPVSQGRKL